MHIPVLLREVLHYLDPVVGDFIIDGTVNGGGHFEHILSRVGDSGIVLGIDADEHILATTRSRFAHDHRARFVCGSFADVELLLSQQGLPRANGFLLDLGFSSLHLSGSGRGFSFDADEPLCMTYDVSAPPLRDILPTLSRFDLERILREYSGERFSVRIADAIVGHLAHGSIQTSKQLADIVRGAVPVDYEQGRIDPATRTFQALRIYVNREFEAIERALLSIPRITVPGARVVVISFHSLEDRLVKHAFSALVRSGSASHLTEIPVEASLHEISSNYRSRSAKLRAIVIQ
ncbi:MAG: S-adenosyl-methyltransferase MraW, rRNA (cytosine1402-N4)-methyltransferase [Candidatus Parcubacteria bacterium]|jgi:16S rRNA (cytosine1402-N4)-methyltransferase